MTEQDKVDLYNLIGMGGLKYYLLKVDPKKRMMFNPAESIELNGNTGPFIQYAHARIQSLLTRGGDLEVVETSSLELLEKEIIKQLVQFPLVIEEAAKEMSPALIANYTYELVKLFNQFYQSVPVLIEEDIAIKNMRLVLSKNVAKVISNAMILLGINVPNRMWFYVSYKVLIGH